jgi:hypothetical protein
MVISGSTTCSKMAPQLGSRVVLSVNKFIYEIANVRKFEAGSVIDGWETYIG